MREKAFFWCKKRSILKNNPEKQEMAQAILYFITNTGSGYLKLGGEGSQDYYYFFASYDPYNARL